MLQKPFHNSNNLNNDCRYIRRISYLSINSKDRNRTLFPQPESYTINLEESVGKVFKNVESIRLLNGEVPDLNNVSDQPFLLLCISQLQDTYTRYYTTSNDIPDVYDMLRFSSNYRQNEYLYIKEGTQLFFKPTLAKLSRLSIEIKDQEGTLFSWGDDSGVNYNITRQNHFIFEITELVKDINKLTPSNVY
jgi:hypothetical protein